MKVKAIALFVLLHFILLNKDYAQYNVGDTLNLWSVTYIDWPPLANEPQRQIPATCIRKGLHCYIFAENSVLSQINQSEMDELVQTFDTAYYPKLTALYGPVPNVFDNDSLIIILIHNEPNWAGYFDPAQQMSDSLVFAKWGRRSNEKEIIYVATNALGGYIYDVVAHEFGHMLHWLQDHSPEPPANPVKYWEEAWIDEGFSTFAEIYLMEDINQNNVYFGGPFFSSSPDRSLIYFEDYSVSRLWTLFMYEHYGQADYIRTLISEPLNGKAGVEQTLYNLGYNETFNDVFRHWVITNYLDAADYENGKYAYRHYNFPNPAIASNISAIPSGLKSATVKPYAADFVHFNATTPKPCRIFFYGNGSDKFNLVFIKRQTTTNTIVGIDVVFPDTLGNAIYLADSLGIGYNRLAMLVLNVNDTLPEGTLTPYSYEAKLLSTGVWNNDNNSEILIFPNPANKSLTLYLPFEALLEITDITGNVIRKAQISPCSATVDVSELTNGLYFLRIISDEGVITRRFIKQ